MITKYNEIIFGLKNCHLTMTIFIRYYNTKNVFFILYVLYLEMTPINYKRFGGYILPIYMSNQHLKKK